MFAQDLDPNVPVATYYLTPTGEYHGPPSLFQPLWFCLHDNYFEYVICTDQGMQMPCRKSLQQPEASLPPPQPPIQSSPTPVIKPPIQVPQNLATQISRDESPDKFVLSIADQKAFRKLFPLRKPLLPERSPQDQRPTLVLDLDETLIHTSFELPSDSQEYESVNITLLGSSKTLYVNMRPWVRPFLKAVAQWYEVVIYTASISTYANSILDALDPTKEIFSHRLYREHCSFFKGVYIKDIESLGRPLETTVFVDNFPGAYMMQPSNALPVRSFVGSTSDNELFQLTKLLKILRFKDDVRPLLRRYQLHWKNIHFNSELPKPPTEG